MPGQSFGFLGSPICCGFATKCQLGGKPSDLARLYVHPPAVVGRRLVFVSGGRSLLPVEEVSEESLCPMSEGEGRTEQALVAARTAHAAISFFMMFSETMEGHAL